MLLQLKCLKLGLCFYCDSCEQVASASQLSFVCVYQSFTKCPTLQQYPAAAGGTPDDTQDLSKPAQTSPRPPYSPTRPLPSAPSGRWPQQSSPVSQLHCPGTHSDANAPSPTAVHLLWFKRKSHKTGTGFLFELLFPNPEHCTSLKLWLIFFFLTKVSIRTDIVYSFFKFLK